MIEKQHNSWRDLPEPAGEMTLCFAQCTRHSNCVLQPQIYIEQIHILESPTTTTTAAVSQKASSDDILGTKRGTIDLLMSKRPEKF